MAIIEFDHRVYTSHELDYEYPYVILDFLYDNIYDSGYDAYYPF